MRCHSRRIRLLALCPTLIEKPPRRRSSKHQQHNPDRNTNSSTCRQRATLPCPCPSRRSRRGCLTCWTSGRRWCGEGRRCDACRHGAGDGGFQHIEAVDVHTVNDCWAGGDGSCGGDGGGHDPPWAPWRGGLVGEGLADAEGGGAL